MSGFDIRLVFTFPPKDITLQYKRCLHLGNNFPCISTLIQLFIQYSHYVHCTFCILQPIVHTFCTLLYSAHMLYCTQGRIQEFFFLSRGGLSTRCGLKHPKINRFHWSSMAYPTQPPPPLNTPLSVHYLCFFCTLFFYSACKVCFVQMLCSDVHNRPVYLLINRQVGCVHLS